jgi:sugar lactone lactonase YvrE
MMRTKGKIMKRPVMLSNNPSRIRQSNHLRYQPSSFCFHHSGGLRGFCVSGLAIATALLLLGSMCSAAERIVLVAGSGTSTVAAPAKEAKLVAPFGIDFDKTGSVFLVELEGGRVLSIDPRGILTTIGGTKEKGNQGDGGPAKDASFNGMHSLAIGPDGTVYLADTWNNRIRTYDPKTGKIAAFAGTGEKGYSGDDGPAAKAKFGGIYSVAFDALGKNIILTDLDNRRVRKIELASGIVTTVAGNGEKGVPADGAEAAKSPLVDPRAACFDSKGNVYVLERSGNALRVVTPDGKIRTVVGTGKAGATGDGGDAINATLNGPKHLCADKEDNIIIADTENHLIRKYLPKEGKIIRLAGSGKKGTAGVEGPPLAVELNQPHGVYLHPSGELYIVDSSNNRVLKIVKE